MVKFCSGHRVETVLIEIVIACFNAVRFLSTKGSQFGRYLFEAFFFFVPLIFRQLWIGSLLFPMFDQVVHLLSVISLLFRTCPV